MQRDLQIAALAAGNDVVITDFLADEDIIDLVRRVVAAPSLGRGPVAIVAGDRERLKRLETPLRGGRTRVVMVRPCDDPWGKGEVHLFDQRWLPMLQPEPAKAWILLDDVDVSGVKSIALRTLRQCWPTVCLCPAPRLTEWLASLELHRPVVLGVAGVEVAQPEAGQSAPFERLRRWRAATARSEGVPAYRILTDRALLALIELKPKTRDEFLAVPGVGEKAWDRYWDRYGNDLLAQLQAAGD